MPTDTPHSPFFDFCRHQVFVDELFQDVCHYSTLTIFNTSILHPTAVIDQTYETRQVPACTTLY